MLEIIKTDKKIQPEQTISPDKMPFKKLLKKYKKGLIFGLLLEYFGLLGIVLGNTGVIPKDSIGYSGGAMIEIFGVIIILIFTYKLCKLFEFSMLKSLLLSVINVSILIY